MRRSHRSVTSRCTTNCTRSPARHLPGCRPADRCSRCTPVRYVTVWDSLVVLTNTERQGRYRERRRAGESRYRRPQRTGEVRAITTERRDDVRREPVSVMRPRVQWPDESRPAVHAGPKVGVGVGPGRAARPPFARSGPLSPSRSSRARDTMRSKRSQVRRLIAAVDADSTGSRPAGHPESGGLPRPVGVVDDRDAPSRPGRKAHNCHLSRGTDGVSPAGP